MHLETIQLHRFPHTFIPFISQLRPRLRSKVVYNFSSIITRFSFHSFLISSFLLFQSITFRSTKCINISSSHAVPSLPDNQIIVRFLLYLYISSTLSVRACNYLGFSLCADWMRNDDGGFLSYRRWISETGR